MISIVVIDDEIQDIERIKYLLHSQGDLELRGFGKDGYDAIRLVRSIKPDIAILNISLALYCGVEISHLLKRDSPSTAIVAMGSQLDINLIKRVVNEAVAAYILKEDFNHLAEILRKVHEGEYYFNPLICTQAFRILASLLQKPAAGDYIPSACKKESDFPAGLSRTEMKILALIGEGYSDKEIAGKLKLKNGTVRNYISRIMRKGCLKSRPQAIAYAIKNGLSISSQ
ncbi:response regulator transcription factor [Leadbettera azotonutricia]|uniref:Putative response regulator n=1 Tax=Leadbettera azotonutricia (strain ATCC BAA-888 / DSM 13862 / ZAS-9) TaxID=545695 RepID=F5Y8N5_LEAAZ|nr:response regulator transcription factor [Leadbettera azotonutricia]AEF80637.1 putative response regulator [Leadbettera azotonutricia ZAS-9]